MITASTRDFQQQHRQSRRAAMCLEAPDGTAKVLHWMRACRGKTISIDFDGVYMNAAVYLNGEKLGTHPYGYTPFSFVLPQDKLKFGSEENVITVKVDHKQPSSRWYSGSGIYRDVKLTVADPVHVANYGTTVTTPDIESGKGTVNVVTEVQNDSSEAADVSVKQTVYEKAVTSRQQRAKRQRYRGCSGQNSQDRGQCHRCRPKALGYGKSKPLYRKTEVYVGDTLKDSYHSDFGFRWVNFYYRERFLFKTERTSNCTECPCIMTRVLLDPKPGSVLWNVRYRS